MSRPRCVVPGATYLITRTCTQRQLWLLPSALVGQAFAYVVAVAAARTGVAVHALCVLGNHWHAVITDREGRYPEFLEHTHKLVAKCLNASFGRTENLWASAQTNVVRLVTSAAIAKELVYTLCNPVSSQLVSHARKWPGLRRSFADGALEVARPPVFFSATSGKSPATATLTLTVPPGYDAEGSDPGAHLRRLCHNEERRLRRAARVAGRAFLGVARILKQRRTTVPETVRRRAIAPRIAAGRGKSAARIAALATDKTFQRAYRIALTTWRAGDRTVTFPAGTYKMRVLHNARCIPFT